MIPARLRARFEHPGNENVKPGEIVVTARRPSLNRTSLIARAANGGDSQLAIREFLLEHVENIEGFTDMGEPMAFTGETKEELIDLLGEPHLAVAWGDSSLPLLFGTFLTLQICDRSKYPDIFPMLTPAPEPEGA